MINPTKTNIWKISKQILEKIINKIIHKTNLRLLKNSKAAIDSFISKKLKELQFLHIDIHDYYHSISKKMVLLFIKFAKKFTYVTDESIIIILNARDTLLIHDEGTWSKKSILFDVPMGDFDSAEITDFVRLYILYTFKDK